MGGLVKSIFGGSSQKSTNQSQSTQESGNKAYDKISAAYDPAMGLTGQAGNAMAGLLGLGGDPAASSAAFNNYRNSSAYDFLLGQGQQGLIGANAARGLFNSGATAKGLEKYRYNLSSQFLNDYMNQVNQTGQLGLGAGQLVGNAGQYSKGQSTSSGTSSGSESTGGLGKAIGFGLSLLSDKRTKKDIQFVEEIEPGINKYLFRYKDEGSDVPLREGVMAQEVEKIYPEAVNTYFGYKVVDYAKIPSWSE